MVAGAIDGRHSFNFQGKAAMNQQEVAEIIHVLRAFDARIRRLELVVDSLELQSKAIPVHLNPSHVESCFTSTQPFIPAPSTTLREIHSTDKPAIKRNCFIRYTRSEILAVKKKVFATTEYAIPEPKPLFSKAQNNMSYVKWKT